MEKELRKAFEEVTTNNVQASIDFTNETRKMLRELSDKFDSLEARMSQYDEKLQLLQIQVSTMQAIVFRGGTSGD